MCTLTWARRPDGYELCFNRDELRTRGAALPPRIHARGSVRWIAPVDPDAGGTWLGVNDRGVSVGVMNGPLQPSGAGPFHSRGLLVDALLDAYSTREVQARLEAQDLARYRPFALVALEPGELLLLARWEGGRLALARLADAARPLASSSRDHAGAIAARAEEWRALHAGPAEPSGELLERFHRSHLPERGALSVCVHRDDASTVSLSRVRVLAHEVTFGYAPGSPCEQAPASWLTLGRAGGGSGPGA